MVKHQQNLISLFAQHKVAAKLLMLMMIMAGVWALDQLNTQIYPTFALDMITVTVIWTGATPEDVETAITIPIEQQLRTLDDVRKMNSISGNGFSQIVLEYEEGTDMGWALDMVKEKVALLRHLPTSAEKPEIRRSVDYDRIANLLITGLSDTNELRHLAQGIERELRERGINKIVIEGLPKEEIVIQISSKQLEDLGLTLPQIGDRIANFSRDIPAGAIGRDDVARQLRSIDQSRDELAFAQLPLITDKSGRYIKLDDIATIERRPQDGETRLTYQGKPAIKLKLLRAEQDDALKAARILQSWLDESRPQLPAGVNLHVYYQRWEVIDERLSILLENGLYGLILVIAILIVFLNVRVAFWVVVGIPTTFMSLLAVLYLMGGSINMVSSLAMIIALGIIVDDAIVVAEDSFAHFQSGVSPLLAAESGAQHMLAPVMTAALTTICAFLPLMLVGGTIGNVMFDIPLVMVCVLIASLIECFLVLPGHLRQSFHQLHHEKPSKRRQKLEQGFNALRDVYFRPLVTVAVAFRWTVLATMLAAMLLAIGLLAGGRLNFTFFPAPEGTIIIANANFVAGTPPERVDAFLEHLEENLYATDKELGGNLVKVHVSQHGGDASGLLQVELISPESRTVRIKQFIKAWQAKVIKVAGLENFNIKEDVAGQPVGGDIEIRFSGNDADKVKAAALELKNVLKTFPGVSGIQDDMPFGQEQWVYSLTPHGMALGLTIESVGQQLRAAFDGYLVQIFNEAENEIEVRVRLPDKERYHLASLDHFTLQLPNGASVPFSTAVNVTTQRGFKVIRHAEGRLAAKVSADVDTNVNNSNKILANLSENFLPDLNARYGLEYSLEGRAADQVETLEDMKRGLIIAFVLIYIILAWQFASYGWPLLVMSVIPFGLVGAIFGHWVMGVDLTVLSLFGFFGLSGVVVNDSIVLVTFYKRLRENGVPVQEALIEAACKRLRPVLLTSLTTIFGLMPLLFEKSLQAQFLIPIAISIVFGLMFSTLLVLLAMPALLYLTRPQFALLSVRHASGRNLTSGRNLGEPKDFSRWSK
jgi:multidrug efflux pump subunit AcrB